MKTLCDCCRYFARYYVKRGNGSLGETNSGYCRIDGKEKRTITQRKDENFFCDDWEKIQIQIQERRENIIKTLLEMAKQIHEISAILQDDNK